jgi:hypothetical protein
LLRSSVLLPVVLHALSCAALCCPALLTAGCLF